MWVYIVIPNNRIRIIDLIFQGLLNHPCCYISTICSFIDPEVSRCSIMRGIISCPNHYIRLDDVPDIVQRILNSDYGYITPVFGRGSKLPSLDTSTFRFVSTTIPFIAVCYSTFLVEWICVKICHMYKFISLSNFALSCESYIFIQLVNIAIILQVFRF